MITSNGKVGNRFATPGPCVIEELHIYTYTSCVHTYFSSFCNLLTYNIIMFQVPRLLALSGPEPVFTGSSRTLVRYFTSADYPCPPFKNPADYYCKLFKLRNTKLN